MKQIFLLVTSLTLFLTPTLAQKFNPLSADFENRKDIQITARDKSQIVKSILLEFDFLNRHSYKGEKKGVVYLSTENISPIFIPKVSGINFVLVSPKEIEGKTNTIFGYYTFGMFKVKDSKIFVSFGNVYRDSRIPCSGCSGSASSTNGISYEFRKVKGKWQGKALNGYASGS